MKWYALKRREFLVIPQEAQFMGTVFKLASISFQKVLYFTPVAKPQSF